MRKNNPYYSTDGTRFVEGMKIIPLQTSEIKTIIEKRLTYGNLYHIFEAAFSSTVAPNLWYKDELKNNL